MFHYWRIASVADPALATIYYKYHIPTHLDDSDGVAARVTDGGTAEADGGAAAELLELVVLDGGVFCVEEVVGGEPGVVPDERC